MISLLLGLALWAQALAEPVLHPVAWLGDLVVSADTLLLGTKGEVVEVDLRGNIRRRFPFPAGQVQALALGGGFLVAGGWDTLRVWQWPTGQLLAEVSKLGTMVQDLALWEDLVLLAGTDGYIRAFSLSTGRMAWSLRLHERAVWGIAATPSLLATAGEDRALVLDLKGQREMFSFPGRAWEVDFSPDGSLLGCVAGKILRVWDTAEWILVFEVWAHESCAVAVAFSPDGKEVATGSLDRTAAIWDCQKRTLLVRTPPLPAPVRAVGFSPDGKLLVAGAEDGTILLLPRQ